jgi:hypothetical protein
MLPFQINILGSLYGLQLPDESMASNFSFPKIQLCKQIVIYNCFLILLTVVVQHLLFS